MTESSTSAGVERVARCETYEGVLGCYWERVELMEHAAPSPLDPAKYA